MTGDLSKRPEAEDAAPYLVVDEFLRTLVGTRVLKAALELGVVDRLAASDSPMHTSSLLEGIPGDAAGHRLLLELLQGEGVVEVSGEDARLSERFRRVLAFRDLLDAKLVFTGV